MWACSTPCLGTSCYVRSWATDREAKKTAEGSRTPTHAEAHAFHKLRYNGVPFVTPLRLPFQRSGDEDRPSRRKSGKHR